ncbi:coiled-coil domain-containing protein 96 [Megalops cyprinoides]|uniref:coiled-coil domain-containing protein 96 n=1 Tax=Megalops cyprinoides TaxID=118141 RepID=UPI001864FCAD|nr:coiled-coil domain-containing protein 96 [Megalops cyprinoides]
MEATETEPTNPETVSDESNPVAEENSIDASKDENSEGAPAEQASSASANNDGNNESAGGSADNVEIAEGEQLGELLSSAAETGDPVDSVPVEGSTDDATAPGEEVAGVETEETTGIDTEVELNEGTTELQEAPTSETFEGGEVQELVPAVPGSGEQSPRLTEEQKEAEEGLSVESPEGESSLGDEEEEAEEQDLTLDYEKYKAEFQELQSERDRLILFNSQLQMKLVEYFRKKTGEDARPEKDLLVSDQEQRYLKYMANMEDMRREHARKAEVQQAQIEELRYQMQEKLDQVDSEWTAFMGLKRDVLVKALSQRRGKMAAVMEVDQLQASEQRKQNELVQVRLENIKLRNKTRRLEALLTASEELAGGLHPIDFEQLKIENQTYEEKIEERNEDLLKLRRKVGQSVQVLTHITEKLQLLQEENQARRDQLAEVDAVVASRRDALNKTKQARDGLRAENLQLRQRCGLLGNETLLRDFEDKVGASESLEQRLEMLKSRHAELTLKCSSIKKRLDESKQTSAGLSVHTPTL